MGLGKNILKTVKAPCQCFKCFVCIDEPGQFSQKIHLDFIFQPGIGLHQQVHHIFADASGGIYETVVIRHAAENTVKPHLVCRREVRVKGSRFEVIHGMDMKAQGDPAI